MNLFSSFWQQEKTAFQKNTLLIIAAISLEYFAWGFLDTYFSLMIVHIFENIFLATMLIATMNLSFVLFVFFLPYLLELHSIRSLLLVGKGINIFAVLFYALGGIFGILPLFFLGAICNGIGSSFRQVATRDYLMIHTDRKHMSTVLGTQNSLCWSFFSVGVMLGGMVVTGLATFLVTKHFGEAIAYMHLFAALPLMLLSLVFLFATEHPKSSPKPVPAEKHHLHYSSFFKGFSYLSLEGKFSLFLLSFLQIILICSGLFVPLLVSALDIPMVQTGLIMGCLYLPLFLSTFFSVIEDLFNRMSFVVGGLLLSLVPLLFLTVTTLPLWIAGLLVVVSFSIAIIQPAGLGIIASDIPRDKMPLIAALQVFSNRLAVTIFPLFFGYLSEKTNLQVVFVVLSAMALFFAVLAIVLKWHLYRKLKEKEKGFLSHVHLLPHSFFHHHS